MSGTIAILAGGKSSRMGQDKTFLPWQGGTFLGHMIGKARPVFDRICICAGTKAHAEQIRRYLDTMEPAGAAGQPEIIIDRYDSIGPMGGLLSVFEQIRPEKFVTVAVDLPGADMRVLSALLEELDRARDEGAAAVMLALTGSGREACAAAYADSARALMQAARVRGEYSIVRALGEDRIRVASQEDLCRFHPELADLDMQALFRNINTMEEYHSLKTQNVTGREGQ